MKRLFRNVSRFILNTLYSPLFLMNVGSVVMTVVMFTLLTHRSGSRGGVGIVDLWIYLVVAVTACVAPLLGIMMWGWSFLYRTEAVLWDWMVPHRGWMLLAGLPLLGNVYLSTATVEVRWWLVSKIAVAIIAIGFVIAGAASHLGNHIRPVARPTSG